MTKRTRISKQSSRNISRHFRRKLTYSFARINVGFPAEMSGLVGKLNNITETLAMAMEGIVKAMGVPAELISGPIKFTKRGKEKLKAAGIDPDSITGGQISHGYTVGVDLGAPDGDATALSVVEFDEQGEIKSVTGLKLDSKDQTS